METELRHQQYIVFYSGLAVLAFGIWSAIKLFISLSIRPVQWVDYLQITDLEDEYRGIFNALTTIFVYIVLFIDSIFRLYICRSAIKESLGRKKRVTYLIIALLLFVVNILLSLDTLQEMLHGIYSSRGFFASEDTLTTVFIEITSHLSLLMLVISGIRIRILRRKIVRQKPADTEKTTAA